MTPEQELDLLFQEQFEDDTPYVDTPSWQVSLDAPVSSGVGPASTVGAEFIGYDPWDLVDGAIELGLDPAEVAYRGDIISHLHPRRGDVLTDPRKIPHGTAGGYTNHKCRCTRCRAAYAALRREGRARARATA